MPGTPKTLTLEIQILQLSERGYVALCSPAGIRVRGSMMDDELNAVRNLLIVMGNANGDADIALGLALEGSTFEDAVPKALGGGGDEAGHGGPDGD